MSRTLFAFMQAFAAAAVAAVLAVSFQVTSRFGAHPFWAEQVIWTGLVLALCLILLAIRGGRAAWLLSGAAFLIGAASARFGKQIFAASFAENALAGRFWYFGWIALSAGAIALIALCFIALARRVPGR